MMRTASGAQQLLTGAAAAGNNSAAAAAAAAAQQGLAGHQQQPKLPVATLADRLADTGKVGLESCIPTNGVICHPEKGSGLFFRQLLWDVAGTCYGLL
jgi:hypothetical protein